MNKKERDKTIKRLQELNKRGRILFIDPLFRINESLKEIE